MAKLSRAVLLNLVSFSAVLLTACGGGGGATVSGNLFGGAGTTTSTTVTTTTTTSLLLGATVTTLQVESTGGSTQSAVPLTFGQVFVPGEVTSTESITGKLDDGTPLGLQVDAKARHADGSLRHAVISAVLPQLNSGQTRTINLVKTAAYTATAPADALTNLINSGFDATVNVTLGGTLYSASAASILNGGIATTWLAGPHVNEWLVWAPLKTAGGVSHPHLTARFAIRAYTGTNKGRVDVIVENNWAYEPNPQNFTYDAAIVLNGQTVYSTPTTSTNNSITHYHHARWRKTFWWGGEPQAHLRHNTSYLIATKAVPNYDQSIVVSSAGLSNLANQWNSANKGPLAAGITTPYMPTSGGRPDIGPLPQWAVLYILSMDSRAKAVTLGTGDLAGSWPIHYRDKNTGLPVSIVDYSYMTLLGRSTDAVTPQGVSHAFPDCAPSGSCATPYSPDSAHQPSLAYIPYLVTGDHYYLEELQFWANYNMVQAGPGARDFHKGIMKWDQLRGQSWSLRTLGQAAYITPDAHPFKQYFIDRVLHNLDFYNTTYTIGNPNQLGMYDGTGLYAFKADGVRQSPWQDDFFTWSIGYLTELGFTQAQPLLLWKSKFPVDRMMDPSYCWIQGAAYTLQVRPTENSPVYSTLAEIYQVSFTNPDGSPLVNSTGARYFDQPCGSQAQANWLTRKNLDDGATDPPYVAGEMAGLSHYAAGYPSNMQPALAVSVASGNPNASAAWAKFMSRSVKPDYSTEPQWAIVPR